MFSIKTYLSCSGIICLQCTGTSILHGNQICMICPCVTKNVLKSWFHFFKLGCSCVWAQNTKLSTKRVCIIYFFKFLFKYQSNCRVRGFRDPCRFSYPVITLREHSPYSPQPALIAQHSFCLDSPYN